MTASGALHPANGLRPTATRSAASTTSTAAAAAVAPGKYPPAWNARATVTAAGSSRWSLRPGASGAAGGSSAPASAGPAATAISFAVSAPVGMHDAARWVAVRRPLRRCGDHVRRLGLRRGPAHPPRDVHERDPAGAEQGDEHRTGTELNARCRNAYTLRGTVVLLCGPRRYMPRDARTYGIVLSRIFTSVQSDQFAT